LLGTGTPIPQPKRAGPSTAVVIGGQGYLVDMGRGVVRQLHRISLLGEQALGLQRLSRVFVTHLHSDHVTGYPDMIATPPILGRNTALQVYGPPGIRVMSDHFLAAFAEDFARRPALADLEPSALLRVTEIVPGVVYEDLHVRVTAFPVTHPEWEYAYGYRFDARTRSIVISGDTAPAESVVEACAGCDVLVHEVYCASGMQKLIPNRDVWAYNRRAHTSAVELGELAARAQPKLLVLTHRLDYGCSPDDLIRNVRRSFEGEVVVGEDLTIY
jgi:ribonuclease Z